MIAVSPKHAERGFQLYEQQRPVDTVSKMRLLAYGEDYHFYFRVWIPPDAGQVEAPNFNFIETTLPVDGKSVRLAIDCQDLIKRLQILADANIVTYAAAQKACLENRFTKFIESIERPLRWKQHLTQIVSKEEVLCLLDFLHSHLPTWQQGTLIPRSESKMLYDFEYGKDGSISIHYTRQQDVEIQLLVMNLDSGETFQFEEIDDKVRSFVGLFNESEGIVQFFEILQMGRSFFAKIPLCDGSLETIRLNFPLSRKIKIARQLASGLAVMEEKQIVHCGIFPSAVLVRFNKNGDEAFLSNFRYAHRLDSPPAALSIPRKWKNRFAPPEGKLSHPFAVPIYQLGRCFELLFGDEPSVVPILKGMLEPNPELRWSIARVMAAVDEWKEPEPM